MKSKLDKKYVIALTVIGVIMLILITIGGTYAYFSIQQGQSSNTTLIQGNVANAGIVTGEKGVTNAVINLSNADMTNENAGKYYATSKTDNNYSIDEEILNVFKASLSKSVEGEMYTCTFDFKVTVTGNESLAEGDAVLNITGTEDETIDTSHDLSAINTTSLSKQITWTFKNDSTKYLNISAYIENKKDVEQNSSLSNANIGIQTSVENFTCNVGEAKPVTLAEQIQTDKPTGYNTTLEGGLYRFQGTTADNYVCFGTSNKNTCTGNTDAYMYRIIGIDSSNRIKLIKKEALNSTYQWHSNYKTDAAWPTSTLYTNLNGNAFLSNTTYIPNTTWTNKIETMSWKYGDVKTYNTTAANLYSLENAWTSTISAKIGLWYMHDYYYGMSGGNNCSAPGAYTTCKTSWIFITNSDSGTPSADEWTMSRYGTNSDGYYVAWRVHSDGTVSGDWVILTYAVRPVFYLTSEVEYLSGSGTLSDPYIIAE